MAGLRIELCPPWCPRNEPEFRSEVALEVPSTESEEPGISRGLEWEPAEGARNLRADPKPVEENDIVDDFPPMATMSG